MGGRGQEGHGKNRMSFGLEIMSVWKKGLKVMVCLVGWLGTLGTVADYPKKKKKIKKCGLFEDSN